MLSLLRLLIFKQCFLNLASILHFERFIKQMELWETSNDCKIVK